MCAHIDITLWARSCRWLRGWIGAPPHFFCQDESPLSRIFTQSHSLPVPALAELKSHLLLLLVALSLLSFPLLFWNFKNYNRIMRTRWTSDQINTCVAVLAIAFTCAMIHYMTR